MLLASRYSTPRLSTSAPKPTGAVFPVMLLEFLTVTVPERLLSMPPPPAEAELPDRVLPLTVSVPSWPLDRHGAAATTMPQPCLLCLNGALGCS